MRSDHRRGLHDEEHLAQPPTVEDNGEHSEDGPVDLGEDGARYSAPQDKDLVAHRENLGGALVSGSEDPPRLSTEEW